MANKASTRAGSSAARVSPSPAKAGSGTQRTSPATELYAPAEVKDQLDEMIDSYHEGFGSPKSKGLATGKLNCGPLKAVREVKAQRAADQRGELVFVDLDLIQASPDQPRKEFDKLKLRELAESILGTDGTDWTDDNRALHETEDKPGLGLLQPLLVARCGGIYELIAGERRLRACRMGGKNALRPIMAVPCYVREMTPAEISAARLVENDQREDLSAVERARAYKKHRDEFGLTQEQLARELGITQGQVCNTERLLNLPDEWQDKIISREITQTQARDLVPFADVPTVLAALKKNVGKDRIAAMPPDEWADALHWAVQDNCEYVTGRRYWGGVKPNNYDLRNNPADIVEQLDIRTIRNNGEDVDITFNKPLAKRLIDELKAQAEAKARKKLAKEVDGPKGTGKASGTPASKPAEKPQPTAAELKAKAEVHAKRLYRYRVAWLQQQIADRFGAIPEDELWVLLIGQMLTDGRRRREHFGAACREVGVSSFAGDQHRDSERWAWVMDLDRAKRLPLMRAYVRLSLCENPAKSWSSDANPEAIESLAATMGIDLKTWRADEAFLSLHTTEQLRELMTAWGMSSFATKKAEIIEHILDHQSKAKAPKLFAALKPCQLD